MTLVAMQCTNSADLQQFVEKSRSMPAAVEDKGKGIPFLAGDLLGRRSFGARTQGHPAEPADRLIKFYSEHGIACEQQQIMSQ